MRLAVFILAVIALVYMAPGGPDLWRGWVLPAVALLSLAWVFWLGGFVAIVTGVLAFHYTDIASDSVLRAVLLPLLIGLSVIYLAYWAGPGGGLVDGSGEPGGCDGGGDGGGCGGD